MKQSVVAAPSTRRILVIVTDGDDRSNQHSAAAAIKLINEQEIAIVVLGLADAQLSMKAIDRLAKETGGRKFLPLATEGPETIADALIGHLRGLK